MYVVRVHIQECQLSEIKVLIPKALGKDSLPDLGGTHYTLVVGAYI